MHIQDIDEVDMNIVIEDIEVDLYQGDNHFYTFQFSPFLDIDML